MRHLTVVICCLPYWLLSQVSHTFTAADFEEQALRYRPIQRVDVDDAAYRKGTFFLSEVVKATQGNVQAFEVADYWNLCMAFDKLEEPRQSFEIAFRKAVALDADKLCEYVTAIGGDVFEEHVPELYAQFMKQHCEGSEASASDKAIDAATYAAARGLDQSLVESLLAMRKADRQYRDRPASQGAYYDDPRLLAAQQVLDSSNQRQVERLFGVYGRYIGRTLVGRELENEMWVVIQHSNLAMMERYLPYIHQAVQNKELEPGPLKLLLDRIYSIKRGVQLFGSQGDIPIMDEKERRAIVQQYGLE